MTPRRTFPRRSRRTTTRTGRIATVTVLGAALLAGVLAVTVPAVAQTGGDAPEASGDAPPGHEEREAAARQRLAEVLAPLVSDGTITDAQRDAVIEQLVAARRSLAAEGRAGGPHGLLPGRLPGGAAAADVAALLDLTPEELVERLRAGETLAEVAADAGTDAGAVVDLLVEAATGRLDAAVEAGRLETGDRDACVASVTAAITAHVYGEDVDRSAVGDSCGNAEDGDGDRDGKDRRRARSALGRLRLWR